MRGKKARAIRKIVYKDKHHQFTRKYIGMKIPWCKYGAMMILADELRTGYKAVKKHFKKGVVLRFKKEGINAGNINQVH